MSNGTYYIKENALTSGGKVWNKNKPVNAKDMKLTDDQFSGLVKAGKIAKGKPPKTAASRSAVPVSSSRKVPPAADLRTAAEKKSDSEAKSDSETKAREDKIVEAIGTLYGPDGKPFNASDLTDAGLPKCPVLEELLKDVEGFASISADERDKAFDRYKKESAE